MTNTTRLCVEAMEDRCCPSTLSLQVTAAPELPSASAGKGGMEQTLTVADGAAVILDFSFGIENPTTIGSATGGAGAGKIKFNEFTIKKTTDSASPAFFGNAESGSHYFVGPPAGELVFFDECTRCD